MRISIGDLTPTGSMGLPPFSPSTGTPFYSGGLTGIGAAVTCPSDEQLQGIEDLNDPCQSPAASLPVGTSSAVASLINAPLLPQPGTPAYAQLMASLPANPPTQISAQTLMIGGGVLLAILLLGMARR